ncbi:DUF6597 domain-containing transcriptional factor [Sandaracinus amylolyticus]|uniref:Transcriptional regulator, AraC family protein n=1 Tax=Sandaracinus amylolyticus TaxID=927083 RepID=A0A0F6YPL6_9BACT|nr:DUF6597 domain-containing transcriptional factor [Sandaracinus amylolyticus]AKF11597.1 Transcriptional regulator, AraC family protein [Sandaracinus amylolyticus]
MSADAPYEEHLPRAALAGVIDRVWTKRERAGREARVLPDGCVDVMFHLGTRPRAVVVGAMTSARVVPAMARDIVAVRFRPGGAARFLDAPVDTITDAHVELDALGIEARPVIDALTRSPTIEARRALVESFVASRVLASAAVDRTTSRAIARLVAPGAPRIAAVAEELGISRQHLARRVRAVVGLGPKELARIARAQRAMAAIARGDRDHAALAIEHGFADQAHLVHELGAIAGMTPGAIARARGSISPITSAFDVAEERA